MHFINKGERMSKILETLWIEKYRPKNLDEMVLSEELKNKFQSFINSNDIPNLLFASGPGSGKTTVSRILRDHLIKDDSDILQFNGSSENGIDKIRKDVTLFLESPPICSPIKLVYVDEADYLSQNAQAALRSLIEQFSEYGRFIFTINYKSRIIKELHSRFQLFEFERLPIEYIEKFCKNILSSENIKYSDADLNRIVSEFYPDIRRIVNVLESNSNTGNLIYSSAKIFNVENKVTDLVKEILKSIENKKLHTIKSKLKDIENIVFGEYLDYYNLYNILFKLDEMPYWGKIHIGDGLESIQTAAIPQISFISTILKIIKSGTAAANQNFYEIK